MNNYRSYDVAGFVAGLCKSYFKPFRYPIEQGAFFDSRLIAPVALPEQWFMWSTLAVVNRSERYAMDEDFPDLPDDDNLAFVKLEAEFRSRFQRATDDQDQNWTFEAAGYMNKTLAAAKALNVEALFHYADVPNNSHDFNEMFLLFFAMLRI